MALKWSENERLQLLALQHAAQSAAMNEEWDFSSDSDEEEVVLGDVTQSRFAPGAGVINSPVRPLSQGTPAPIAPRAFGLPTVASSGFGVQQPGTGFGNIVGSSVTQFNQPQASAFGGFGGFGGRGSLSNSFGTSNPGFGAGFGPPNHNMQNPQSNFGFGAQSQAAAFGGTPLHPVQQPIHSGGGDFGPGGFGQPKLSDFGSNSFEQSHSQNPPPQTDPNRHQQISSETRTPGVETFEIGGQTFTVDLSSTKSERLQKHAAPAEQVFEIGGQTFTTAGKNSKPKKQPRAHKAPVEQVFEIGGQIFSTANNIPSTPSRRRRRNRGPKGGTQDVSHGEILPLPPHFAQNNISFEATPPANLEKMWNSINGTDSERLQQMWQFFLEDARNKKRSVQSVAKSGRMTKGSGQQVHGQENRSETSYAPRGPSFRQPSQSQGTAPAFNQTQTMQLESPQRPSALSSSRWYQPAPAVQQTGTALNRRSDEQFRTQHESLKEALVSLDKKRELLIARHKVLTSRVNSRGGFGRGFNQQLHTQQCDEGNCEVARELREIANNMDRTRNDIIRLEGNLRRDNPTFDDSGSMDFHYD